MYVLYKPPPTRQTRMPNVARHLTPRGWCNSRGFPAMAGLFGLFNPAKTDLRKYVA